MQALSTCDGSVQHHAQHVASLFALALAALVGKATLPPAQGHSIRSVASKGGSCAGSWPPCISVSALLPSHSVSQGGI